MMSMGVLVTSLSLVLLPVPADEVTIRLTGVPEHLVLPLAAGTNRVLTAVVKGGRVESVWLARSREARGRVLLDPAAAGEYQINLADPEVTGLLRATGGAGRFRIFARTADGKIVASMPVRYAVRASGRPGFILVIEEEDRTRIVAGRRAPRAWFAPERVQAISFIVTGRRAGAFARARLGRDRYPFSATDLEDTLRLTVSREIRRKWAQGGRLLLEYGCGQTPLGTTVLRARPVRLALRGRTQGFTLIQRRRRTLPGSLGYLTVRIGDITAGQVMVTVRSADQVFIEAASMREGDRATLRVGGKTYLLTLVELVNFLIGDDYALFMVSPPLPELVLETEMLYHRIGNARATFLLDGQRLTPKQIETRLRRRLAKREVTSLEGLVDAAVAACPGAEVRLPGDVTMPLAAWLRERAGLEREPEERHQQEQAPGR